MLAHDEEISLFLDVAGSCSTKIELNELFETESDEFTLIVPSVLKVDWRNQIITRIKEDTLYDRSCQAQNAVRDVLAQDLYLLTRGESTSCLHSSTLCQMMDTMLTTHKPCCVVVRLPPAVVLALALQPRAAMTYVLLQQSVKPSAPITEPVAPPATLLIVECATHRSLSPPGPASNKGDPRHSPLPVDRAYGVQVTPPYLQVPAAPPVLHHQHAPVLAGPALDPWPRDVPMYIDRGTQRRRPHHFVDALVPLGDDPPSINPPDVDFCPALPAPDLHCHPRGCDGDARAPRAHPTCSTIPTPIPPAVPPHNNGAPTTLGDPPPVATSLLLIFAATTHTSTPPCCTTTQHRCAS
jgi:hypothetical protein